MHACDFPGKKAVSRRLHISIMFSDQCCIKSANINEGRRPFGIPKTLSEKYNSKRLANRRATNLVLTMRGILL
jgi:hypothetical protein